MAMSPDKKLIAVGEGKTNKRGNSFIFLYDAESRALITKLSFH